MNFTQKGDVVPLSKPSPISPLLARAINNIYKKNNKEGLPLLDINKKDETTENSLESEDLNEEDNSFEFPSRGYFSDSVVDIKSYDDKRDKDAVTINDFNFIRLINKGAFGKVWLVKRKYTEDFYAMKIINFLDNVSYKKKSHFFL